MEGIHTVDDVYNEVKKMQLENITNGTNNHIVLFTVEDMKTGVGIRTNLKRVLLSIVDMEDDSQHNAIIINDHCLIATSNHFVVSEDDNDGEMCIGGSLLINKNDHEYNEINVDDVKN